MTKMAHHYCPTLLHLTWPSFSWSTHVFLAGFARVTLASGAPDVDSFRGGLLKMSIGAFVALFEVKFFLF